MPIKLQSNSALGDFLLARGAGRSTSSPLLPAFRPSPHCAWHSGASFAGSTAAIVDFNWNNPIQNCDRAATLQRPAPRSFVAYLSPTAKSKKARLDWRGHDVEVGKTGNPSLTSRRRLLIGLGAAGSAAAAAMMNTSHAAAQNSGGEAADAPVRISTQQRQPFYGEHQPGILTPRPAAGMIASFDVTADTSEKVERLFRTLTRRISFLMEGGEPPKVDPRFPPADSGILGPVIAPDNLTITVSLGASFFTARGWLASQKPARLSAMTAFPNDALDPSLCHGDLSLQICANTTDTTIHALRDIVKNLPDLMVLRWKQEGSVPVLPPRPDGVHESARNFLGFRDGTANPSTNDAGAMNKFVWVQGGGDEPPWAAGGTYQVVRIIRNFVERWDRTPLGEQERIIGRRKSTGAPFAGQVEDDRPDYAADPDGKVTPLSAHIRLANPRTVASTANTVLRRPFNYSNGVSKSGQLEQGLLFIACQADLEKGFVSVQRRLNGEPLEEYIKPIGGGYFFTLPGATSDQDFIGRTLLQAAGLGMSGITP
jgi:deferrochelatase/peroxidase EfeB